MHRDDAATRIWEVRALGEGYGVAEWARTSGVERRLIMPALAGPGSYASCLHVPAALARHRSGRHRWCRCACSRAPAEKRRRERPGVSVRAASAYVGGGAALLIGELSTRTSRLDVNQTSTPRRRARATAGLGARYLTSVRAAVEYRFLHSQPLGSSSRRKAPSAASGDGSRERSEQAHDARSLARIDPRPLRQRLPPRGPRRHDVICQTRTRSAEGASRSRCHSRPSGLARLRIALYFPRRSRKSAMDSSDRSRAHSRMTRIASVLSSWCSGGLALPISSRAGRPTCVSRSK